MLVFNSVINALSNFFGVPTNLSSTYAIGLDTTTPNYNLETTQLVEVLTKLPLSQEVQDFILFKQQLINNFNALREKFLSDYAKVEPLIAANRYIHQSVESVLDSLDFLRNIEDELEKKIKEIQEIGVLFKQDSQKIIDLQNKINRINSELAESLVQKQDIIAKYSRELAQIEQLQRSRKEKIEANKPAIAELERVKLNFNLDSMKLNFYDDLQLYAGENGREGILRSHLNNDIKKAKSIQQIFRKKFKSLSRDARNEIQRYSISTKIDTKLKEPTEEKNNIEKNVIKKIFDQLIGFACQARSNNADVYYTNILVRYVGTFPQDSINLLYQIYNVATQTQEVERLIYSDSIISQDKLIKKSNEVVQESREWFKGLLSGKVDSKQIFAEIMQTFPETQTHLNGIFESAKQEYLDFTKPTALTETFTQAIVTQDIALNG